MLTLRHPTPADIPGIVSVMLAYDYAYFGEGATTAQDIDEAWHRPNFTPKTDAWVLSPPSGEIVAYGDVWERQRFGHYYLDTFFHPDWQTPARYAQLLAALEARLQALWQPAPAETEITLHASLAGNDPHSAAVFVARGYTAAKHSWHMRIQMDAPPPAPVWPAEVRVTTLADFGNARAVHACAQAAFSDLSDFVPMPFEDWQQRMNTEIFNPTMWHLAVQGAEVIGTALCHAYPGCGWVQTLSVRRAWRKQGLGRALLCRAFGDFYQRGLPIVELGVDAANATGATRLYERAGMRLARRFTTYEKTLKS
jgi:ribosomal protein S18 acetylase RimI-like enzyme